MTLILFWVLVALFLILLWFLLAFLYKPVGRVFYRIWKEANDEINNNTRKKA